VRAEGDTPNTVLICHDDEPLNRFGLARWLASWTNLVAIVVIREPRSRKRRRIRRELRRVGIIRFFDVIAFRFYQRLFLARQDLAYERATLAQLESLYADVPSSTRVILTDSPNSVLVEQLLRDTHPTFMIARCKTILRKTIFTAPSAGTFVMHPGICPEYRNAHGCFWALARRDLTNVGMTLLRVDQGVDTGAIFGYFSYDFDECVESHNVIQDRVVFDNLASIRKLMENVLNGTALPQDTSGRQSGTWGQPWMSRYLRWKRAARREREGAR
jgi:folate-dependent phosphoribosylglycinamide formyltransferase PurN